MTWKRVYKSTVFSWNT